MFQKTYSTYCFVERHLLLATWMIASDLSNIVLFWLRELLLAVLIFYLLNLCVSYVLLPMYPHASDVLSFFSLNIDVLLCQSSPFARQVNCGVSYFISLLCKIMFVSTCWMQAQSLHPPWNHGRFWCDLSFWRKKLNSLCPQMEKETQFLVPSHGSRAAHKEQDSLKFSLQVSWLESPVEPWLFIVSLISRGAK